VRRDWPESTNRRLPTVLNSIHHFSLSDAVSFAVMPERRIDEAMTPDHRFEAAGFRAIPER
jgi:predicted nucleic acid-binding protein